MQDVIAGLEVTELAVETIVADDRWRDIAQEERRSAQAAATLSSLYATRADDCQDPQAERVLVRCAGQAWRHGLLQARYPDRTARVLMLDGPARQVWHVQQSAVVPLDAARLTPPALPIAA